MDRIHIIQEVLLPDVMDNCQMLTPLDITLRWQRQRETISINFLVQSWLINVKRIIQIYLLCTTQPKIQHGKNSQINHRVSQVVSHRNPSILSIKIPKNLEIIKVEREEPFYSRQISKCSPGKLKNWKFMS